MKINILIIIMLAMIVGAILLVIFAEKTVRKLRKNPATRDALGIEFISGWDIVNVVTAFGLPRRLNRYVRNSPYCALNADADLLEKYMTRFDIILAKVLFILWVTWALSLLILMLLDKIGVFK